MADGEFDNVIINNGATGNVSGCGNLKFEEDNQSAYWCIGKRGSEWYRPDNLVFSYFDGSAWHQLLNLDPLDDDYVRLNQGKLQLGGDVKLYRSATNTLSLASGDKMVFNDLIESKQNMPHYSYSQFITYMANDEAPIPDTTSKIRFADLGAGGLACDIFGLIVTEPETAPFFALSHHLAVKKDAFIKGQVVSLEGCVTLYGGYAGWAPTNNPFIWLGEGGAYGNKDTLEIRIVTVANPRTWGYGDLICRDITCRNVYTDDTVFANGWRLTEDPEESGMMLVRPDGSVAQQWS